MNVDSCVVGLKVIDTWYSMGGAWGDGEVTRVENKSIYIKFEGLKEESKFDHAHIRAFVEPKYRPENPLSSGYPDDGSCAYCGKNEWDYVAVVMSCSNCNQYV